MNKDLREFAESLKADGYTVYTDTKEEVTYFCKGNKLGCAYLEEFSGMIIFSTIHKPCVKYGGGLRVFKVQVPLLEHAQKTLAYEYQGGIKGLEKYSSWEEFRENTKYLMLWQL